MVGDSAETSAFFGTAMLRSGGPMSECSVVVGRILGRLGVCERGVRRRITSTGDGNRMKRLWGDVGAGQGIREWVGFGREMGDLVQNVIEGRGLSLRKEELRKGSWEGGFLTTSPPV
jgi:hypothetical protein